MTSGSHCRNATATVLLGSLDQLMKTRILPAREWFSFQKSAPKRHASYLALLEIRCERRRRTSPTVLLVDLESIARRVACGTTLATVMKVSIPTSGERGASWRARNRRWG